MTELRSRIQALSGKDGSDLPGVLQTCCSDTDQQERQVLGLLYPGDPIRIAYCGFIILDSYLLPLKQVGHRSRRIPFAPCG